MHFSSIDGIVNFFYSSNMKEQSCFFPVPQAAECILRVVERSNAPVIYLSTDAAESETDLLQSLLLLNDGKRIPLVKRPGHNSVEKWDALIYRNHLGGNTQVDYLLYFPPHCVKEITIKFAQLTVSLF